MSLQDVSLPKKYKDGDVLFEQTLDAWRQATEQAFATMNLNFTQLAKDIFPSDYDYNNDGNQTESKSLQEQITDVITGATPITGTSADSFTINTDGNSSTLTTASLSAIRTHALPDISGTFMMLEGAQTVSGAKTFVSATFNVLGIKIKGAGVGIASLQYANSADSRDYTIPDAGAAADFVMTEGTQSINGAKTFAAAGLKVKGAGVGVGSIQYANSADSRTHTIPDGGSNLTFAMVGLGDWDTFWADAVHDHSSNAEGGAIPWASITPDPNLTYDNVAESISQVWDFTVGAQLDQIRIEDNDIFERDTNSDSGIVYLNRVGHNGTTDHFRDTIIGNGKGINLFEIDGSSSSLVAKCEFYTDDSNVLVDGEDTGTNVVGLNRQVTPSSLNKGWVYFSSDGSGNPTILASYNVASVVLYGDSFRITWTKPFTSANYVTVATQEGTIASPFDSILIGSDADIKSAADVVVTVLNSSGGQQTENVIINLVAFGDLAS